MKASKKNAKAWPGGLGSKVKSEFKEFKKKQQNINMNDDRRQ